jgi:carbonic anhydrase
MNWHEALAKLKEGNNRFVKGDSSTLYKVQPSPTQQTPFASVLCCCDSRVQPILIFDVNIGELYNCRTAGNVADKIVIASIEYAALNKKCPLLVVMGHNFCGAVTEAIKNYKKTEVSESINMDFLVRQITPAIQSTQNDAKNQKDWIDHAIRKNVINVANNIKIQSSIIRKMVEQGNYKIIGAMYDLTTRKVEFFE